MSWQEATDGRQWPFGLAGRYADDYGAVHLLIDDGGGMLESAYPLQGEDPDGTRWAMTYWLPRDAVIEVSADADARLPGGQPKGQEGAVRA